MGNSTLGRDFPVTYFDNCVVVKLPQCLTLIDSIDLKRLFLELIEQNKTSKTIILDFNNTQFIDSTGIGALVKIHIYSRTYEQKLILQQVSSSVMAVFQLADLTEIFELRAIESLQPKRNFATHPSIFSPLKRLIDIIGATMGLIITAVIFLPIAIAIKLDSPGPVLFSQIRCGCMGRSFKIWKFRSMCINAETMRGKVPNQAVGAFFKNNLDPRVTRVGRFLRRNSLDEFPQFWNVLKGEMSMVGTRPPTPEEVKTYNICEWQRLNVKPGITGEWQVNGRSHINNFEDVIKLDLRYQKNWSLLYDLKLILKTILIIFNKNSGAV